MRRPRELPDDLRQRAFTRADLRALDLAEDRVQRRDIRTVSHGVFLSEAVGGDSLETAVQLAQVLPDCWISHFTAARLYGWDPPRWMGEGDTIHLSQARESRRRIRRSEVTSHRQTIHRDDLRTLNGVRLTSPARTWVDLACSLSEMELVCFGDHLVRTPYFGFEGRSEPYASLGELLETVARVTGVPGRRRALAALERVRVGADSGAETRLRLAFVDGGLPEPALQVPLHPEERRTRCADLGYPALKIAIQYEGPSHFTPDRAKADHRRDNEFLAAGWIVLRFNERDHAEGFRSAVRQVREAIARRQS